MLKPGDNLGLVIRGGVDYGVGIFVIEVDPGSVAEKLGLEVSKMFLRDRYISYTVWRSALRSEWNIVPHIRAQKGC